MTQFDSSETHEPVRMHYVGFCRICGTGPLGVRACGACGDLVVLCDECGALWTHPRLEAPPTLALDEDAPCPSCGASLWDAPAHWATSGEIAATAWLARAVAEGKFTLRTGAPLGGE